MTKRTPAEIIAAMSHEYDAQFIKAVPTDPYGMELTRIEKHQHRADCKVCQLAAANTAYLETVVQEAMDLLEMNRAYRRPTVAEVLAAADAKFREGT